MPEAAEIGITGATPPRACAWPTDENPYSRAREGEQMLRPAILLTIALAATVPLKARAAVTKSILLACKEEADLRMAAKLRSGGDRKAAVDFEAGKKANGS